jgi:hypothetical protein
MIEIEVCERLMDSWQDVFGNRHPKYHAQVKDKPGFWGCGRTPEDAIGSLIRNNPEILGVQVTYLGRLAR